MRLGLSLMMPWLYLALVVPCLASACLCLALAAPWVTKPCRPCFLRVRGLMVRTHARRHLALSYVIMVYFIPGSTYYVPVRSDCKVDDVLKGEMSVEHAFLNLSSRATADVECFLFRDLLVLFNLDVFFVSYLSHQLRGASSPSFTHCSLRFPSYVSYEPTY